MKIQLTTVIIACIIAILLSSTFLMSSTTPATTTEEQQQQQQQTPPEQSKPFIGRTVKEVITNRRQPEGRGVYVRRSIGQSPRYFDPFALLDDFHLEENSLQQGIGFFPHPHRGISTLTYILPIENNGSVVHKDHKGHRGEIFPGDVQFMSAGKGIVHSEMPGSSKAVSGLQLWINLRKEEKLSEPQYQEYAAKDIPKVTKDGVTARIIAGTALGGSAKIITNTPVHYIHYTMEPGTTLEHEVPPTYSAFVYTFNGDGYVHSGADKKKTHATKAHTVIFSSSDKDSDGISITAGDNGFDFVLIAGEPLGDGAPVIQHGPMIMNSQQEIRQAFMDFQMGVNGFEGAPEFQQSWSPTD